MKIDQRDIQEILSLTKQGYDEHFERHPDSLNLDEFAFSLAGTLVQTFYNSQLSDGQARYLST